jgi:hypothetical protein
METGAAHEVVGATASYALVGVVLVAMTVLAVLRWQPQEGRAVVVRRSRVVRVPSGRLVPVVPGLERAVAWPPDLLDLPLEVRGLTLDGHEVRVLVELVVWVPPPRPGEEYADPVPALERAARELVAGAVRTRTAPGLVDSDGGLVAALGGTCLREGRDNDTIGVVATVELAEIDLLLSVPPGGDHGRR